MERVIGFTAGDIEVMRTYLDEALKAVERVEREAADAIRTGAHTHHVTHIGMELRNVIRCAAIASSHAELTNYRMHDVVGQLDNRKAAAIKLEEGERVE